MTRLKLAAIAMAVGLALPLAGAAEDAPGVFKVPGTDSTIKFNGFAEVGFVYDLSGDNGGEFYLNSPSIALDGTPDAAKTATRSGAFNAAVAYTRFGVQTNTPSAVGAIGTRFEGDFAFTAAGIGYNANGAGHSFTHSTPFRVRHAYGTVGDFLLIGQTWSTFADLAAYPDQQDENPVYNLAPIRAPMIRVMFPAGPAKISLAAESPYAQSVSTYHNIPDFIARLDLPLSMGSFSVRGVTKQFQNGTVNKQGFGGALGAAVKVAGDTLVLDLSGGTGMGAYQAATLAGPVNEDAVVVGSEIKLFNTVGGSVGFTHVWTPQLRSNLIGSAVFVQTPDNDVRAALDAATPGSFGLANHRVFTGMLNTYWAVAKNFWVGPEYAFSYRRNFAGTDGKEHRIELTSHFDFL